MISASPVACKSTPLAVGIAGVVVSVLLSVSSAYAQAGDVNLHSTRRLFGVTGADEIRPPSPSTPSAVSGRLWAEQGAVRKAMNAPPLNIRRSLATLDYGGAVVSNGKTVPAFRASPVSPQRSTGRKVAGGVIGAVGGFFAGGFLGAKLEGECGCDDPGLRGAIIGAPIGAVVGGILGAKLF